MFTQDISWVLSTLNMEGAGDVCGDSFSCAMVREDVVLLVELGTCRAAAVLTTDSLSPNIMECPSMGMPR